MFVEKVYTKTGDAGETSLLGGGRVSKASLRIETYGTLDELNSILGIARSMNENEEIEAILKRYQDELFVLGSDLAAPSKEWKSDMKIPCIGESHVEYIEKLIDTYQKELPQISKFILPGGTRVAAFLHHARTVCRRAERLCVSLSKHEDVSEVACKYLNRLSDMLFVLARLANYRMGRKEIFWESIK